MKRGPRFPLTVFILAVSAAPVLAAPAGGLSYVQATVVTQNAISRTLSFVDASGHSRSHAVSGAAADRVGRLRPGDEVIVVLSGSEPVVQDIRVSHAAPAPAAAEPAAMPETAAAALDDASSWTVVPAHQMRPAWPNPYSRFYTGPKPATKRQRP